MAVVRRSKKISAILCYRTFLCWSRGRVINIGTRFPCAGWIFATEIIELAGLEGKKQEPWSVSVRLVSSISHFFGNPSVIFISLHQWCLVISSKLLFTRKELLDWVQVKSYNVCLVLVFLIVNVKTRLPCMLLCRGFPWQLKFIVVILRLQAATFVKIFWKLLTELSCQYTHLLNYVKSM